MTTLTWTGSGNDGNWNNAANWSGGAPGAVPGSGDTIVVNSTVVLTTGPNLNHGTLTVQTTNPGSSIRFVNSNFNNSTVVVTGPVAATFVNGDNLNNITMKAQSGGQINLGNPGGSGGSPNLNGAVVEADEDSSINVNVKISSAPNGVELLLKGGTLNDNVSTNGTVSLFQQPRNGATPINLGNDPNSTIHYGGSGATPVSGYLPYLDPTGLPPGSNGSNQINCFLAGTLIETASGLVAVENIVIGDQVVALVDGDLVLREVVWTGVQPGVKAVSCQDDYPVRIRKDALATDIPARDLLITSEHCLFVDGKLIPARMLVNGRSIAYERSMARFDAYHFETEVHSIVMAEGMAVETYLNTGNGRGFVQTGKIARLQGKAKDWMRDAAAPLTTDRASVEPIYKRVEARAIQSGFPSASADPIFVADADLRLQTDRGQVLRPVSQDGGRAVFALPRNTAFVRILSRTVRPSEAIGPYVDDRRDLGVLVGEVNLRDRSGRSCRSVDSHLTNDHYGWHAREASPCRWTEGDALLPLRGIVSDETPSLEIQVLAAGPYIVSPGDGATGAGQRGWASQAFG